MCNFVCFSFFFLVWEEIHSCQRYQVYKKTHTQKTHVHKFLYLLIFSMFCFDWLALITMRRSHWLMKKAKFILQSWNQLRIKKNRLFFVHILLRNELNRLSRHCSLIWFFFFKKKSGKSLLFIKFLKLNSFYNSCNHCVMHCMLRILGKISYFYSMCKKKKQFFSLQNIFLSFRI